MNKKILKLIVVISLAVLTSCGVKEVTPESYDVNAERLKTLEDAYIHEEVVSISQVEDGRTYQEITYPILTSTKKEENIQKALDMINADLKAVAESFKEEHINDFKDGTIVEDERGELHYSHDSTDVRVTNRDDKYLSFMIYTYDDYMGAHPVYYIAGYTFDVKTGTKIELKDLIKDKEEFRKYLKKWCKENNQEGLFFEEYYEDTINSYVDAEYRLEYYIDKGELYVIFQIYDIAPYAAGAIHVPVAKELLK